MVTFESRTVENSESCSHLWRNVFFTFRLRRSCRPSLYTSILKSISIRVLNAPNPREEPFNYLACACEGRIVLTLEQAIWTLSWPLCCDLCRC